jgi:hypothetical protein
VTRKRLRRWLREVRDYDPAITIKDLIDYLRVRREWPAKRRAQGATLDELARAATMSAAPRFHG